VKTLKPGTYVLTQDVKNPEPDRRVTRDWTKQPTWEKGLRLVALYRYADTRSTRLLELRDPADPHSSLHTIVVPESAEVLAGTVNAQGKALVAALEPAPDDLDSLLTRYMERPRGALEALLRYDRIHLSDVERVLQREQLENMMDAGIADALYHTKMADDHCAAIRVTWQGTEPDSAHPWAVLYQPEDFMAARERARALGHEIAKAVDEFMRTGERALAPRCAHCGKPFNGPRRYANEVGALRNELYDSEACADARLAAWAAETGATNG
jgi:hypothetical protein